MANKVVNKKAAKATRNSPESHSALSLRKQGHAEGRLTVAARAAELLVGRAEG